MRVTARTKAALFGAVLWLMPGSASGGPAINQFEIKDLQSAPGDFEFQSQNAWTSGQSRRAFREIAPGEYIYDDNSVTRQREALEVQLGVTDWFRVRLGVEYEQERLDDPALVADADSFGSLQFSEVAIEGVIVFVKPKKEGIGLGLLMEYGSPVNAKEEASEFYVGPILEMHTGPWSLITNTMLVKHIGGTNYSGDEDFVRDDKWDFAYFTQLQYEVSQSWAFALEAYGTLDRIGNSGRRGTASAVFGDHDQHRAGPIIYYTFFPFEASLPEKSDGRNAGSLGGDDEDGEAKQWSVTVGSGVLLGLNDNTPEFTYKLSVEVDY